MMSWDSNPYSEPEKYGLTMVGDIDFSSGSYEFDITAVWKRNHDGVVVWADDAGCSCPSPFEDTGVDDLTSGTVATLQAYLEKRNLESYDDSEDDRARRQGEIVDLIGRLV